MGYLGMLTTEQAKELGIEDRLIISFPSGKELERLRQAKMKSSAGGSKATSPPSPGEAPNSSDPMQPAIDAVEKQGQELARQAMAKGKSTPSK